MRKRPRFLQALGKGRLMAHAKAMGAVLLLLLLSSCNRKPPQAVKAVHETLTNGVRMVDLQIDTPNDRAIVLRYESMGLETPVNWAVVTPGTRATCRVVLVENLNGTCGVYLQRGGDVSLQTVAVPKAAPNALRTIVVSTSSPSAKDLENGPAGVIAMKWLNGNDPNDKDKIVQFFKVTIGYSDISER